MALKSGCWQPAATLREKFLRSLIQKITDTPAQTNEIYPFGKMEEKTEQT
jgi:hypothetical protein